MSIRMSVDRRAVVPAIAVLVVGGIFAFAPPASASTPTVSETGGVVTYTAPAGENNGVVVNDTATEVLVLDNAYALTPGAGCTAVTGNTHEVQCARAANASVVVHLGDGTNGVNNATNLPSSLYGGSGDDLLGGGGGNDKLYGYGGNDKLYGYAGNDLLVGGTGADLLNGGSGNDTVSYADHTTRVTANLFGFGLADDGNATDGPEGARDNILNNVENLTGGSGNDVLIGSDVRNVINGGAGGDIIYGGPGDDLLYGGAGKDVIDGSTGNDECFVQTPTDAIPTAADGSTIHCEITQLPH